MVKPLRLGVNVDHVATIRNARGGDHPDPLIAAKVAAAAGADGITAHLREDRRHIRDADMFRLKDEVGLPLNFEMAATDEMALIAADVLPESCCLVPERREELTTEGGLTVHGNHNRLRPFIAGLQDLGIRVSLFIDPEPQEIEAAKVAGADIIELHTGPYVEAQGAARQKELERLRRAAVLAERLGLECHAGHGLNYETIEGVAAIPQVVMVNIGHFLIGESVTVGLPEAIRRMRQLMETGRRQLACT